MGAYKGKPESLSRETSPFSQQSGGDVAPNAPDREWQIADGRCPVCNSSKVYRRQDTLRCFSCELNYRSASRSWQLPSLVKKSDRPTLELLDVTYGALKPLNSKIALWKHSDTFRNYSESRVEYLVIGSLLVVLPILGGITGYALRGLRTNEKQLQRIGDLLGEVLAGQRSLSEGMASIVRLRSLIDRRRIPSTDQVLAAHADLVEFLSSQGVGEATARELATSFINATHAQVFSVCIRVEEIVVGDKFQNVSESTIVNRSVLQNAFNQVAVTHGPEILAALESLASQVKGSGNPAAIEILQEFTSELAKPEPRKPILQSLWSGLIEAAPSILELAGVAEKVKALFLPPA